MGHDVEQVVIMEAYAGRMKTTLVLAMLLSSLLWCYGGENAVSRSADGDGTAVAGMSTDKYQEMEKRLEEANNRLAAANARIGELSYRGGLGRVKDIEKKAFAYGTLQANIQMKDDVNASLNAEIENMKIVISGMEREIVRLSSDTNRLSVQITEIEQKQIAQKKTLDLIRLGKYEYYEVKAGDSCESIAAMPSIYGDMTKHVIIRQANRGNVLDVDNLVVGEMLIIPRFEFGASYDF